MANTESRRTASMSEAVDRCACVRALWTHMQARDWTAARLCYADDAVMHWPCTQERLMGADTVVRVNAEYPEGWSLQIIAVDALADGRVQSVVRVDHNGQSFFANSCFRFERQRIAEVTEYWGTAEDPPAWRSVERLGSGYSRVRNS